MDVALVVIAVACLCALIAQSALHRSVVNSLVAEAAKERHRLVSAVLARTPGEAAHLIRAGEPRQPQGRREKPEVIHPEGF